MSKYISHIVVALGLLLFFISPHAEAANFPLNLIALASWAVLFGYIWVLKLKLNWQYKVGLLFVCLLFVSVSFEYKKAYTELKVELGTKAIRGRLEACKSVAKELKGAQSGTYYLSRSEEDKLALLRRESDFKMNLSESLASEFPWYSMMVHKKDHVIYFVDLAEANNNLGLAFLDNAQGASDLDYLEYDGLYFNVTQKLEDFWFVFDIGEMIHPFSELSRES